MLVPTRLGPLTTMPAGWLQLIAGDWAVSGNPRPCAPRVVRADRTLSLRTLAASTDVAHAP